jgi:hypothetical protein
MVACGVDHNGLFMDKMQAQCLVSDIFGHQFTSCLDITFKELDEHLFKAYSDDHCPGTDSYPSRNSQKYQSICPVDTRRVAFWT